MYFLIGGDGKEYGPKAAVEVREWIAEGRLNAQSQIKPQGEEEWVQLDSLLEFAADLNPKTATPVPPLTPISPPSAPVAPVYEANEHIEERRVEQDRVVMSATYAKDQDLLRLEQEKIESGERAEVDRLRRIGLMQQDAPPPTFAAPTTQSTNGFAIAGMVLGILSIMATYPCCGIPFNILGLIFSGVALTQIKANPQQDGKGMAIAGLICSILSVLLIGILILLGVAIGFANP